MKRLLFFFLVISFSAFAQTGIGTTTPNASAKLDVYSTNKGFLPPRVTLTSVTDATTIASPAEGLLVYNLGSVGLQAGYYYWNGANWATIATATSAGNGVTATNLVNLYAKGYSAALGDIAHTNGYSFAVPVSGRYLFDFSSTGFSNATITYKVRQGTTDIGTDAQTSINNTVHVEYNGKIEVNLQSGVTYNVYVNSTGNRDAGDYDRVYYKLVAGNLPVTGQSVDYVIASLSAAQTISAVGNVQFNTIQGAGITLNSGGFNLTANKTYKLEGSVGGSSTGYIYYAWVDATNTIISGGSIGSVMKAGSAFTDSPQDKAIAFYTPTTNTTVYLRVLTISGTSVAYPAVSTPAYSSTWASIEQIGSSAFVNPWILSGTNTFNVSGNVGIGNNSPTSTLDVTGSLAVSGSTALKSNFIVGTGIGLEGGEIDLANAASGTTLTGGTVAVDIYGDKLRIFENGGTNRGVNINLSKAPINASGELIWKVSGIVNSEVFVSLDNIKAGPTRNGAGGSLAGLSIAAVSTSFVADISATYSNGGSGGNTATGVTYTTSASNSAFGWGFSQGNQSTYIVNDTTNSRVYRIVLMIGASYNNNFISIERLY